MRPVLIRGAMTSRANAARAAAIPMSPLRERVEPSTSKEPTARAPRFSLALRLCDASNCARTSGSRSTMYQANTLAGPMTSLLRYSPRVRYGDTSPVPTNQMPNQIANSRISTRTTTPATSSIGFTKSDTCQPLWSASTTR